MSLEKEREVRYQATSEISAELRSLKQAIESGRSVTLDLRQAAAVTAATPRAIREPPLQKRSRLLAMMSVLALVVVVVAGTWLFLSRRGGERAGPLRVIPFSGLSGFEDHAAFSPDGKQLAYVWDGGSGTAHHLYVNLIGIASRLQLTHDSLSDMDPAWSPDGRHIAFIRYSPGWNGKSEVISISALGGPEHHLSQINPPRITTWDVRHITWSPDGKSVIVADKPSAAEPPGIFQLSLEDGTRHRLTSPAPGTWGDTDPALSPDAQNLAFVRWSRLEVGDIYLQDANAAEARRLTFDDVAIEGLAWTPDGRNIVFSSGRSGLSNLWRVPVSGGEIEPLAGVGGNAYAPAVSRSGNLLAYTRSETNVSIWTTQVTPAGRFEGSPTKLISGTGMQADSEFSPDGKRIVFASDRSGETEIWVADADGSDALQLTSLRALETGTPHWSPDGRWIAFDSRPRGRSGVFVIGAEGGKPRRLTPPRADVFVPNWSRDGRWIYFCSNRNGVLDIWKMPAEGGEAVQVTWTGGFEARESKDGKWLYYTKLPCWLTGRPEKPGIWRKPVEGGAEALVLNKLTERLWTLSDEYLYFMDVEAEPHATINRLDLATGKISRMAEVENARLSIGWTGLSVSSNHEWIIYPQVDKLTSRIMLVENFRW
jgi:Tol biopolymer transport system component